jgi:hypothetical protein
MFALDKNPKSDDACSFKVQKVEKNLITKNDFTSWRQKIYILLARP